MRLGLKMVEEGVVFWGGGRHRASKGPASDSYKAGVFYANQFQYPRQVLVDWERSQAATYDRAGLFIFWDLACGRASHTILAHEGMVLDAEVDWGDTARSVTVGSDCRIAAWTADRQVCSIRLQGEDGDLDDLVDGGLEVHWKTSRLVTCWDRAVWVWDLATGRTLHTLRAPAGSVKGFNVDWDSSRCVAWVSGGQCLLWCLRTGQLLEKLIGPTSAICGLACCWEEDISAPRCAVRAAARTHQRRRRR
ncbi:Fbxw7 [Symbiodinium natans]|uniref:Fbxw7 protein n=1 Tax=Symbiodinium natans TaxID=878477 RepID=A0A812RWN9_9DINO|nr:Fbxw7 [Symbiodinium natans]